MADLTAMPEETNFEFAAALETEMVRAQSEWGVRGLSQHPGVVLADAAYWSNGHKQRGQAGFLELPRFD
jgi:hypothetical protein